MTRCCRICMKLLCEKIGTIEDCTKCVSEVYLALQKIDKKLNDYYGGENESKQV